MKNRKQEYKRSSIPIQFAEEDGVSRIQIFKTGVFFHGWYGEIKLTKKIFKDMIRNFKDNVLEVDLMIDYNHRVEEAAAWIDKLVLVDTEKGQGELWAEVKYTDEGKQKVEGNYYRYISGDFTLNFVHNETQKEFGPVLKGAALTNRPFIKGMAPTKKLNDYNGGNGMTFEELEKENKQLKDKLDKVDDKHRAEVRQLKDAGDDKDKKIKELEENNKQLTEEQAKQKKEADFSKLLTEKKAVPAQKEAFLAGDMIKFAELAQETNDDPKGTGKEGADKDTKLSDDDKAKKVEEMADKLLSENKAKDMGEAISIVLSENPELVIKDLEE
jgi:hypothetical protein